MRRPRRPAIAVGTALSAVALPLLSGVPAHASAGPAWRIVAQQHYGARGNLSGYSVVVTPGRKDAWAFGGSNPGGPGSPTAVHWDGTRWRSAALPAGLQGFIVAASASSPANVWALGYSGSYVLRWTGAAWTVAHRWRQAGTATSIAVISRSDVWVFGGDSPLGSWHYDGRSWTRAAGLAGAVYRASALDSDGIWAVSRASSGHSLLHYNGAVWSRVPTAGTPLATMRADDVLAASHRSVWVEGMTSAGRLVVVHWNGTRWREFAAPWQLRPQRFAPDGAGGIWIPAVTGALTPSAWILHLTPGGRWSRTKVVAGLASGVADLALIPGTRELWGSGGYLTGTSGIAAIWRYGALPGGPAPRAGGGTPATARFYSGQAGPASVSLDRVDDATGRRIPVPD